MFGIVLTFPAPIHLRKNQEPNHVQSQANALHLGRCGSTRHKPKNLRPTTPHPILRRRTLHPQRMAKSRPSLQTTNHHRPKQRPSLAKSRRIVTPTKKIPRIHPSLPKSRSAEFPPTRKSSQPSPGLRRTRQSRRSNQTPKTNSSLKPSRPSPPLHRGQLRIHKIQRRPRLQTNPRSHRPLQIPRISSIRFLDRRLGSPRSARQRSRPQRSDRRTRRLPNSRTLDSHRRRPNRHQLQLLRHPRQKMASTLLGQFRKRRRLPRNV